METAAKNDCAVVCVGNTWLTEKEETDRFSLKLNSAAEDLILDVAQVNPNVIVVIYACLLYTSMDAAKKNGGTIYFGGVNLKKAAKESKDDATLETVRGGIEKNYVEAMNTIRDMAKNGFETGTTKYLSAKDDAFICDLSAENVKYLSDNPQDFERLSDEKIAKDDSAYTPKHSVDSRCV